MSYYISKNSIALHGSVEVAAIAKLFKTQKVEKKGKRYIVTTDKKVLSLEVCTKSNALYSLYIEYTVNKKREYKMLYLRETKNERA